MSPATRAAWLREVEGLTRAEAERFLSTHGDEVEGYRRELTEGIKEATARLRLDVEEISGGDALCVEFAANVAAYVDWLQWSLWDLPYFAVALRPDRERFRERVASCAFVYLAGRVFDDVLDRHFWYKGRRPTLLAAAAERHPSSEGAESLTILGGLLLCAHGLLRISGSGDEERDGILDRVLGSFQRAVVGAILEHAGPSAWDADYYERLIHLKNVDFWRILYTAIDPGRRSPLYPFLERYYAFAQKLNDVMDFPEDERRGQPNLMSLYLADGAPPARPSANGDGPSPAPSALEDHLGELLRELCAEAEALPERERAVAMLKLGETLSEARRVGLFGDAHPGDEDEGRVVPEGDGEAPPEPLGLEWFSTLSDVVDRAGADALEQVSCPVCGSSGRDRLLGKQGFTLHRCRECSHVYVSPRLRQDLQLRMADELEHQEEGDDFLDVQRILAEPICQLLRLRAPGPRLLDLGFGRGWVLRQAQAYGFETYGVERSRGLIADLEPQFGNRLHRGELGEGELPWGSFDVVVMTHVLEHLPSPGRVLERIWSHLNPGGILYVAVPDVDSLQFRIFGRSWGAISPLVHYQYFTEESLGRLLVDAGFKEPERVVNPPLPRELTPRWMELMRRLGGDESGELAMLAVRPALERIRVGRAYLDGAGSPGPGGRA